MIHGVLIEKGLNDWQIVQHQKGFAQITVSGRWIVTKDAVKFGFKIAEPMVRVVSEEDNSQIIPWTKADSEPAPDGITGLWHIELLVPAGGPYRLETGLQTESTTPGISWMFRGDTRLHFGVGDVFLIAGQSNSAGYGKDSAYDPPELGVHIFRNRRKWDLACHPLNEATFNAGAPNADMGVTGTSPYLSFGKTFKHLSHYPVGLIASAKGGMPMKMWKPGKGKLYQNMLDVAKQCGPIAGVLWYQGCSDTNKTRCHAYKGNFYEMILAFRKDLGYPVKFFTYQLNRELHAEYEYGYGIVREAQRAAAHELPGVYVMSTMDCRLSDGIHNSAHSCVQLGERMARMCANVLYGTPAYFAPDITSAAVSKDSMRVTLSFANMKRAFAIPNAMPDMCGFSLHTADGKPIEYEKVEPGKRGNELCLLLKTPLPAGSTVSFAWEDSPTAFPVMDEVTYLPPLAFYRYPINPARK